ncbi:MAG: DMT family transporter [Eubacterium sp.]
MGNSNKSDLTKGIIYGGMAGVLWGTLGIFIALLQKQGLSDIAVSSMGPMIVILFYGIKTLIKNPKAFNIGWKRLVIVLVGGGIANAVLYYSYARALGYLSTGVFSILEFSHVFILMLLSAFIFKYKITKGKIASLGLAIVGLALVLNVFSPDAFINPMGIMWMVLNWVANCAIALIIKWALNNEIDNDVVITYYNLGAALIYWRDRISTKCHGAGTHHRCLWRDDTDSVLLRLGQILLTGRPGHHQYDECFFTDYRIHSRVFRIWSSDLTGADSGDWNCYCSRLCAQ